MIKDSSAGDRPDGDPSALARADRETRRAASLGFDWDAAQDILDKLDEEIAELRAAQRDGCIGDVEAELGDVLFTVVNFARRLNISAERALHGTTDRFLARFAYMEERLAERGKRPEDVSLKELDALWEAAKRLGVGVRQRGAEE